jgi:hypothetical protein
MRRHRRTTRLAAALCGLSLLGAACTDGDTTPDGTAGPRTVRLSLVGSLQPFKACDDLLTYLRDEAGDRVTAYGLPGIGGYGPVGVTAALEKAAVSADVAASPSTGAATPEATSATDAFSTTNTVEAGIDEGDVVKTDGRYLYLLAGGALHIVTAGEDTPRQVGSVAFDGSPERLLLAGSRLIVSGQTWVADADATTSSDGDRAIAPEIAPIGQAVGLLWEVDLADPSSPVVVRSLQLDGTVLSMRVTDGIARVVVRSNPPGLDFVMPSSPKGEARALAANRDVIASSRIEDWLGGYRLKDRTGKTLTEGRLADCAAVSRPAEFHGFTTTAVLSIDLAKGLREPEAAAVLADGQRVYASAKHLYLAIGEWQDPARPDAPVRSGSAVRTAVHRFTFDGPSTSYTATGSVTGSVLNDFSMSELDGVLRVATTAVLPWGTVSPGDASESFVTTLGANGDELAELGRVGGLGKGETIRGVRFIGTNAYVVTFRQTDPLYVVDLRDPARPAVTGELKMNGYSGYLHPIGPDRLLGIGQDATDTGRITGGLVAVFDVSDPARPVRTAAYSLPGAWLGTEWDHQSFLWWAPENLALITGNFTIGTGMQVGGVLGLDVGATTLTERGRIVPPAGDRVCPQPIPIPTPIPTPIPMPAPAPGATGSGSAGSTGSSSGEVSAPSTGTATDAAMPTMCFDMAVPITRTVIVGSRVHAISDAAVQTSTLAGLAPLGRVSLG